MKAAKLALCLCTAMTVTPSFAQAPDAAEGADQSSIVVTAVAGQSSGAGTKTDVPLIETPQPISIINAETYQAQGAISIADTLRYVSGVVANPYGADGREDGAFIRGISPLQFRDGMRDLFSYFANIRSDPYNFSQVEVVRGPASVLFGSGSIGGLINTVSKRPDYETHGEMSVRYGSFDRKEILGDVTGSLTDGIAARLVARVRDADTQVDHVSDDRVMLAPSLRFKLGEQTELTLLASIRKMMAARSRSSCRSSARSRPTPMANCPTILSSASPVGIAMTAVPCRARLCWNIASTTMSA